jgi:serine/threonine-protein kinase
VLKDANARFEDGAAFVAAIDDIRAGRPLPEAPTTVAVAAAVPPLRGPDPDPPLTGTVSRPPTPRRRSRVAMILLPILGLLAGAGIAVALLQSLTDPAPGSPANAAEQRDSGSIVLDADDFIGDPVSDVTERLTGLGLDVQLRKEVRDDVVPDRVTDVRPDGKPLAAGDTVVVTYAVAGADGGGADGETAAVTGASGAGGTAPPADGEVIPGDGDGAGEGAGDGAGAGAGTGEGTGAGPTATGGAGATRTSAPATSTQSDPTTPTTSADSSTSSGSSESTSPPTDTSSSSPATDAE